MERTVRDGRKSVDLTRLILSASASDRAPAAPIQLHTRFRVVSVYKKG